MLFAKSGNGTCAVRTLSSTGLTLLRERRNASFNCSTDSTRSPIQPQASATRAKSGFVSAVPAGSSPFIRILSASICSVPFSNKITTIADRVQQSEDGVADDAVYSLDSPKAKLLHDQIRHAAGRRRRGNRIFPIRTSEG